jgi:hypothetical protein
MTDKHMHDVHRTSRRFAGEVDGRSSNIPLRSTGDIKKEVTAKNGGELCLTLQSINNPWQDPG